MTSLVQVRPQDYVCLSNCITSLIRIGSGFSSQPPYCPPGKRCVRSVPGVETDNAPQDISNSNILINHFDRNDLYGGSPLDERGPASFAERVSLRERGLARYCLFDFDISMIFSPDAPSVDCRLDSSLSHWGIFFYHPPDTKQGEFDYDPFPFDVACLGNLLAEYDVSHVLGSLCICTYGVMNIVPGPTHSASCSFIRQNDHPCHIPSFHRS